MINSELLDKIIEQFETNPAGFDLTLEQIEKDNILCFDILLGSHAELLTDEEMDYLVFLYVILYEAIQRTSTVAQPDEKTVEQTDESTWDIVNEHKDIEACFDTFVNLTGNEDLVEFIYSSLDPDDESAHHFSDTARVVMISVLISEVRLLLPQNAASL